MVMSTKSFFSVQSCSCLNKSLQMSKKRLQKSTIVYKSLEK